MTNIRIHITLIFLSMIFAGCIQPDQENLWTILVDKTITTNGFARDVHMQGDTAFIAAGQSGLQIWSLQSEALIDEFESYGVSDLEDVGRVYYDSIFSLVFIMDQSKIYFDEYDSALFEAPTQVGDSHNEDFLVLPDTDATFYFFYIDRDAGDGFQWRQFELQESILGPLWSPTSNIGQITTSPSPLKGLATRDQYIAVAGDQLGVYMYSYSGDPINLEFISRVDTEGNAEDVNMTSEGVFVSCDDAGAYFIPTETFLGSGLSYRFAEDLTVDHIALKNDVASLSLGSKGIALYDISDPTQPEERGIFPIGYSYRSVFWEDKLLVCTREGMHVITIEK
ncbi:MAG: hypothetical protein ACJZ12_00510 [Candidatus Neomarinimicrobiota bacterium]